MSAATRQRREVGTSDRVLVRLDAPERRSERWAMMTGTDNWMTT
jgi:hypothetical protein